MLLTPLPNRPRPLERLPHPPALPRGVDAERGICGRSLVFAPPSFILLLPRRAFTTSRSDWGSRFPLQRLIALPARSRKSCEDHPRRAGGEHPLGGGDAEAERGTAGRSTSKAEADVAGESLPFQTEIHICASLSRALLFVVGVVASRKVSGGR
ncbi:hypothetical protein B0H13DRAFT_2661573 [Mycena leptocephala]|nr:hypothetical protein B0H13DRAFT_2661573 [Mycena leptocephala]